MVSITKQQISVLQLSMEAKLSALLDETRDEMSVALKENYIDIENDVGDKADESFADTSIDIDNAMIGLHLEEVSDLNAALDRIKEGSFGVCVDCEEDIDFARLSAYPTAKRCLSCQQMHEKKHADKTTPSY